MTHFNVSALLVATTVTLLSIGFEAHAPAQLERRDAMEHGFLHRRALSVFERKQAALRDSIVRIATAQLGAPYVLGGTTPKRGFDCSGLVRFVYTHVNIAPPRTAQQQARLGAAVGRELLRPGDLLTFGADSVTHIGIYIGDGRFVHASSVAGRVIVSQVDRRPAKDIKPLAGARRVLTVADAREGSGG
jgi:cell wall-associated NlpC family hydrolase